VAATGSLSHRIRLLGRSDEFRLHGLLAGSASQCNCLPHHHTQVADDQANCQGLKPAAPLQNRNLCAIFTPKIA
jgi:hypothetical protein